MKQPTKPNPNRTTLLSVLALLESLTVAIILAFVFRGFVVEAFVIPTGSMAETLMGEHAETICPNCRFEYPNGVPPRGSRSEQHYRSRSPLVCPNCGSREVVLEKSTPRHAGDRVLVLKPLYFLSRYKCFEWMGPKRWDVVVFLFPGNGKDNYIKRLTGLPGESVEVIDGDLYINGQIARKTPAAQNGLWVTVFDNDYQRSHDLRGWPPWQSATGQLKTDLSGRVLKLKGRQEIIYDRRITNSLGYNALRSTPDNAIVDDLRLSFDAIPSRLTSDSELTAVLSKRDRLFRVRLTVAESGPTVELQQGHRPADSPRTILWRTMLNDDGSDLLYQPDSLAVGQSIRLALQNVDYTVSVWVDGREVLATTDSNCPSPSPVQAHRLAAGTVAPPRVAITTTDCDVDLLHLKLQRDVYYTSPPSIMVPSQDRRDDPGAAALNGKHPHGVGEPFVLPPSAEYPQPAYFMLGDNSSDSQDSRYWWGKHKGLGDDYLRGTVPRSHMIGKAFFVYWPAGGHMFTPKLPFVPRVGKMRLIH